MESSIRIVAIACPREAEDLFNMYEYLFTESQMLRLCNLILESAIDYMYSGGEKKIDINKFKKEIYPDISLYGHVIIPIMKSMIDNAIYHQFTLASFKVTYVNSYQIILSYKEEEFTK